MYGRTFFLLAMAAISSAVSVEGSQSLARTLSASLLRNCWRMTELGRMPSGAMGYGGSSLERGGKN